MIWKSIRSSIIFSQISVLPIIKRYVYYIKCVFMIKNSLTNTVWCIFCVDLQNNGIFCIFDSKILCDQNQKSSIVDLIWFARKTKSNHDLIWLEFFWTMIWFDLTFKSNHVIWFDFFKIWFDLIWFFKSNQIMIYLQPCYESPGPSTGLYRKPAHLAVDWDWS